MAIDLPVFDPNERCAETRPARGEYRLEQKAEKRKHKAAEDAAMAEAVKRDGGKCRWPRCEYRSLKVAAAHLEHRKMGGNPTGDKTQRHKLIALCIRHHDQFDGRALPEVDVRPVHPENGTNGPCEFYRRDESGEWRHVATERVMLVSATRSQS